MTLPVFKIVESFPPEYMHCVLLGVVKLFLTSWFNSKNHEKNWYLGVKRKVLDEKMENIFPPKELTRTPRLLQDLERFKATEFRNFFLYYSMPVLKDLLPTVYYKH